MNIKTMLSHCGVSAEVNEFASHTGRTVQITTDYDPQFVSSLVQTQGFYPVPREHATAGLLEFTNAPHVAFELAEELDVDPEATGASTARSGRTKGSGGGPAALNDLDEGGTRGSGGNGRGFKVLKDGETHKFAQKIFTTILNNHDMGQYGAFLYDVDHLFSQYFVEPEPDYDEGEDGAPMRGVQPQQQSQGADPLNFEGANASLDVLAETASNRSQFLKAMMKLMSGDNGEAMANSFVSGDTAAFAKAFQSFANKAVAAVPSESEEDDATTDTDDEDNAKDDASTGDDTDSDDTDSGDTDSNDASSDEDADSSDNAEDADAEDDDGEPNGDNAGGLTQRMSSAEAEELVPASAKTKPKAPKPGGETEAPRVVVRIPNNMVGDAQ